MSKIGNNLKYNQIFVKEEKYKPFETSRFLDKKLTIIMYTDTRLIELLPATLNIKNGVTKIMIFGHTQIMEFKLKRVECIV